jgi:hypothetical protein
MRPFGPTEGFFNRIESAGNVTTCRIGFNSLGLHTRRVSKPSGSIDSIKSFAGSRGGFSKEPLAAGGQKNLQNNLVLVYTFDRKEKELWW